MGLSDFFPEAASLRFSASFGGVTVMTSSVMTNGLPMGDAAARAESCAAPMLTAPPMLSAAPPTDKGMAEAAEVTWPEAATECPVLALA